MTRRECCFFLWACPLLGSGAQLTFGSSQTKVSEGGAHALGHKEVHQMTTQEFWDTTTHLLVERRGQGHGLASQPPKSARLSQDLGPASWT